jgi:hypothetical protein
MHHVSVLVVGFSRGWMMEEIILRICLKES